MMDRRIGVEALPPLPDDLGAASEAKARARQRLSEARSNAPEAFSMAALFEDMRVHNGFGPRLELAYQRMLNS